MLEQIVQTFGYKDLAKINRGIENAYNLVNDLCKYESFLLSPNLHLHFQLLYNSCVEHFLHEMAKSGAISVSAKYNTNQAKNYKYLSLEKGNKKLNVSSNNIGKYMLPRASLFRCEQSYQNQTTFFDILTDENETVSYGLILHKKIGENGYAKAESMIGIPDCNYTSYLAIDSFTKILDTRLVEIDQSSNDYLTDLANKIKITYRETKSINGLM